METGVGGAGGEERDPWVGVGWGGSCGMEMGGTGGEEGDTVRGGSPRLALLQSLQLQVSRPPLPPTPHTFLRTGDPSQRWCGGCRSPGGAKTRLSPV